MIRVVVGRIGRAHGIRGDVVVDVRTDEPDRRFARDARLHAGQRSLTVASTRWHSGRLLVRFAEASDRTAAEGLHGTVLEADVDPAELPSGEAEYYDRQLIGLDVRTADGTIIGSVSSVVHHAEQDTLVVSLDEGEALVPFVSAIVPTVDVEAGYLTVADLPGLLDTDTSE